MPTQLQFLNNQEAIERMDELAMRQIDFLFVINYQATKAIVLPIDTIDSSVLRFSFNGKGNDTELKNIPFNDIVWNCCPPTANDYKAKMEALQQQILHGNSYLANLTQPIGIETNLSLLHIYNASTAKYKLWVNDMMVCFSPESFVTIDHNIIKSYPMKGTIQGDSDAAIQQLFDNKKETAEHATIVDLIRNDLSMVANNVSVPRYRYIDKLKTNKGALIQTSSEVKGTLLPPYINKPGTVIFKLLPAGSITGAPKERTVQILKDIENYDRGFYTGVMGTYSKGIVDSAVMIRFIDIHNGKMTYKAGGGITSQSKWQEEYNELIEKTYVPICRND